MKKIYNYKESEKAITLIALVITIILLVILAGIAINLSLKENGLFNKAKYAKEKYLNAQSDEEKGLNELYEYLATGDLPENTKDTKAGTLVKIPDEWKTNTPNYVSTINGDIVKKTEVASTVYAVSDGEGNTVPVPIGFWYVGGNLSTGVVISDKEADSYKKNGKDMSEHSDTTKLIGNQFVWIPCTESEYHKYNEWNGNTTFSDGNWDITTPEAEKIQVEKYKGFYVGRYEAGIADEMDQTSIPSSNLYNIEGIPQSKASKIPWTCIDWYTAKKNAKSMYAKNDNVSSGLITGTQWDTMLKMMIKQGAITEEETIDSTNWGNHSETTVKYEGRILITTGGWNLTSGYSTEIQTGTTTSVVNGAGIIFTTGASEQCKKYNIYDIAGNTIEMTDEMCGNNTDTNIHIYVRGGSGFHNIGGTNNYSNKVCSRYSRDFNVNSTNIPTGYRVVLYIK